MVRQIVVKDLCLLVFSTILVLLSRQHERTGERHGPDNRRREAQKPRRRPLRQSNRGGVVEAGATMRGEGVAVPAKIHMFARSVGRTFHTEPLMIIWM